MEILPGLRVVRGPDWKWGDQDGGEGSVGSVVELRVEGEAAEDGKTLGQAVVVGWDTGNRSNYRCGVEGKYDLRILDSGPTGVKHPNIVCDYCRQKEITGTRWKCTRCSDFDLCSLCYNAGKHSLDHPFKRVDLVDSPGCRVPPRIESRRISAKGMFPTAEVKRGHDWLWGDQDGGLGKSGVVLEVRGWENETFRSVVEVEWRETKKKNVYRVGHKGKIDLKCSVPGDGGLYYPDHLPVLGAPPQPPPAPAPREFQAGDRVRVQLDVDVFKLMQEGHGGWNDAMAEAVTEVGTVQTILDAGDLRVQYPSNKVWTLNPDGLTKVPQLATGDVIRILDDIATVHDLQEGHGGWVDDMALSLGQAGRVIRIFPTGDVRVSVNGRAWTYNPLCMVPAPGENPPEVPVSPESETEDLGLHLKLLSLLDNPAVIVAAAAAGDVVTLKDYLTKHPKEVNAKAAGKCALHCAAMGGNTAVIKVLLEFRPNLEVEDEDGDKPLHLCAYGDEDEAANLLIDAGANVNARNQKGATPAIIAAVKGHFSVLRILANHPSIQLHIQDSDGDTALHCAVLAQKNESVSILLEAGGDPTLLNFRLFTPIHEAARIGFLPAMEQFTRRFPHHVNLKKDDGYTALHLSALNDHLDLVTMLAELDSCDLNAKTNEQLQTPLHLSVLQGHAKVTERLVGFGADLNAQDSDGDTPLHLAVMRDNTDPLSADTPQLKKVRESFPSGGDVRVQERATVSCFLAQEGADVYAHNHKGGTPVQICSSDVATLLLTFVGRSGTFHGSLKAPPPSSPRVFLTQRGPAAVQMATGSAVRQAVTAAVPSGTTQPPGAVTGSTSAATAVQELCFLCEAPVDVKFEPCGHALMCSECAERAKRCPTCKKAVKTISKLVEMCKMCKEEPASVTLRPCGHQFCAACARRMKVCFECRSEIVEKEGLPPGPQPDIPGGVQRDSTPCSVCLTEVRDTAFICGHQLCWACAQRVDHCPVCRKFVTHRIRLFL